jgi:hypothetical protein
MDDYCIYLARTVYYRLDVKNSRYVLNIHTPSKSEIYPFERPPLFIYTKSMSDIERPT